MHQQRMRNRHVFEDSNNRQDLHTRVGKSE